MLPESNHAYTDILHGGSKYFQVFIYISPCSGVSGEVSTVPIETPICVSLIIHVRSTFEIMPDMY